MAQLPLKTLGEHFNIIRAGALTSIHAVIQLPPNWNPQNTKKMNFGYWLPEGQKGLKAQALELLVVPDFNRTRPEASLQTQYSKLIILIVVKTMTTATTSLIVDDDVLQGAAVPGRLQIAAAPPARPWPRRRRLPAAPPAGLRPL